MRKFPCNESSSSQCNTIVHEKRDKSAFRKGRIVLSVLSATILVLLYGTIGASTTEIIHVVQFQTIVSKGGLPSDWSLQEYRGTPSFKINQNALPPHLQMISSGETAFGFRKNIYVDIQAYPYLNWTWKATRLPKGGDIRKKDRDDQSIQIYLALQIPGGGGLFSTPPSLAYIWDNEAPKNILVKSPQSMLSNVRYLVLRNGKDNIGMWFTEKRNILKDVHRAFDGRSSGSGPIMVKGVLLFINTHHTGSDAEGCIGNIYFSNQ
jgi:Protein of unknown function (DUF3047)